ncbi:MAG: hypothetical protein ABWY37_08845 [Microbacterium pygmaeum]
MEPFLLFVEGWWWVAPAAAGAGTAAYAGLTMKGRRARRLELDAARHEEATAYRALIAARAKVSEAQAEVLAAHADSGAPGFGSSFLDGVLNAAGIVVSPETSDAKRRLLEAKRREKSAAFALRATRTRVKAISATYHAASATDPLPLEKLFGEHDAVLARWMRYETDPMTAFDHPQLSDSGNPATLAFLRAQREASTLRPASAREKVPPQRFVEYRDAVRALRIAFDEAERQAGAAPRPAAPPRSATWPIPSWLPNRPQA